MLCVELLRELKSRSADKLFQNTFVTTLSEISASNAHSGFLKNLIVLLHTVWSAIGTLLSSVFV